MKLSPNKVFKEFKITLHGVILKKMMSVRINLKRFEVYEIFTRHKSKKVDSCQLSTSIIDLFQVHQTLLFCFYRKYCTFLRF